MATTFGWKRKCPQNLARKRAALFDESNQIPNEDESEPFEEDWRVLLVKRGVLGIEDSVLKSKRLQDEGVALAEQQRYWEAISRWNEAISLTPKNEKLYEMKSQVLLELHELFPAIQAAEKAVSLNPQWFVAHQTLGRAQMGFGDPEMGVKSFSKAVHLQPDDLEMWTEDLHWAWKLRDQKRQQDKEKLDSISTQHSKELSELYTADLDTETEKDEFVKKNKQHQGRISK
ncbi:Tetratricopeptide repeat protein 33 [Porites harrisoni]